MWVVGGYFFRLEGQPPLKNRGQAALMCTLVAGIVAEAVFDTVEVEFLCVKENCRGKGYGRALLRYVEEQAKKDGRKRILLNTYSFQAPEFYRSLGYEELLRIDPCFKEYKQYYFHKKLDD